MSNELNYVSNYDFDDLVVALENRLKATGVWKDTYESSTGQMIIEFYAYMANMILHYLERRAEEGYWDTAQNKSSLINLARLINYVPKRNVSATGTLIFSRANSSTERISIPQDTECQTSSGVKFVTITDAFIDEDPVSSVEIDAIQGEIVTLEYDGNGSASQEYIISSTKVENDAHIRYSEWDSIRVTVNGEAWEKQSSFIASSNIDKHYTLRTELDDTLTVVFGDDINGKAPGTGDTIRIKYLESDGLSGNVYESGKVTILNDTLKAYDSNTGEYSVEVDVSVTNSSTMTGGDDAEDLEEVRAEAPDVFATGDRLVTKSDFKAFIMNYESVVDVNVWGEAEEDAPNYDMFNLVKLCILLADFNLPTASFKSTLSSRLYDKSMITVKYEYIDAVILNVIPVIELYVVEGYALTEAQTSVRDILDTEFSLGSTTKLGVSKFKSNIVESIDSLSSVSYLHLTLEIRKILSETEESGDYGYEETLEATPVLPGSVNIYIGDSLVATDDESGGFTDSSSTFEVSGTVNYTTGAVYVDIVPTPSGTVSARYQQDSDGDIVVENNQVCKLYDTEFDSISYVS